VSLPADDPALTKLREQVAEADRAIIELVNARIELVAEIKRHKEATGREFLDRDRERWLVAHLQATSRGPLSPAGVEELAHEILDLTKREVARDERKAEDGGTAAG
jgi:chorismate mutase